MGDVYEVPASPPAFLMLELLSEQQQAAEEVANPATIKRFLEALLGTEQYNKLANSGVSLRQFTGIVQWLISAYGAEVEEKKTVDITQP